MVRLFFIKKFLFILLYNCYIIKNMAIKHLSVKVFGRVQRVFFRYSAKQKAKELGIKGFVRNEEDGLVYIEAEGEEENLKQFLDWCRRGPFLAKVKKVEFVFSLNIKNFDDFVIE